jgi:hypothetical protein
MATFIDGGVDLLCCGSRRSLAVYSVTDSQVTLMYEIAIISTPKTLHFISSKELCVGSLGEVTYVEINSQSYTTKRLFSNAPFKVLSNTRPTHTTCNYTASTILCTHGKSCYRIEIPTGDSKLLFEWSDTPESIGISGLSSLPRLLCDRTCTIETGSQKSKNRQQHITNTRPQSAHINLRSISLRCE